MSASTKKTNSRSRTEGKRKTDKIICKECCYEISNEKWLFCDTCEKEICTTCLGIHSSMFELVATQNKLKQKIPCVEIICKKCKEEPSLKKLSAVLVEVQKTQNLLSNSMQQVENKMKGLENRLNFSVKETIKKEIEGQLSTKLHAEMEQMETRLEVKEALMEQKLFDHIDSKWNPSLMDSDLEKKVVEIVREEKREEREREKRKTSLIMYNIPEPQVGESETMKNEDLHYVKHVINHILKGKDENIRISNVIRLGKRREEYLRPLKVVFNDVNQKFFVLKKSNNLKSSTDTKCSNVYIAPDKTNKERQEYKKLKEEIDRIGDPDLIIRRGKIVKRGEVNHQRVNSDTIADKSIELGRNSSNQSPNGETNRNLIPIETQSQKSNQTNSSRESDDEGSEIFSEVGNDSLPRGIEDQTLTSPDLNATMGYEDGLPVSQLNPEIGRSNQYS